MELYIYKSIVNQLESMNKSAQERALIKYFKKLNDEEVDKLSDAQYVNILNKISLELSYDDKHLEEFEFNNTIYKVKKDLEITAEDWVNIEIALEKDPNNYETVLAILTSTTNPKVFQTLDHKIAMPIIIFFFNIYKKLDPSTQLSIQLLKTMKDLNQPELQRLKRNLMQLITI